MLRGIRLRFPLSPGLESWQTRLELVWKVGALPWKMGCCRAGGVGPCLQHTNQNEIHHWTGARPPWKWKMVSCWAPVGADTGARTRTPNPIYQLAVLSVWMRADTMA